jgi:two-component sensor histidine kinase
MKRILLLILFLNLNLFAQKTVQRVDSIKDLLLNEKNVKKKIKLLAKLDSIYIYENDINNEALTYLKLYKELSKKTNDKLNYTNALVLFSAYFFKLKDTARCISYADSAIQYSSKNNIYLNQINSYSQKAKCYNYIDDYEQAIKYYLKAINIYKQKFNDKEKNNLYNLRTLGIIYGLLGTAYLNNGEKYIGYQYYLKSKEIAEKTHDYMRKSYFLNLIGWTYYSMQQYDKAEKFFKQALKDSAKIKIKIYNISNHHGLGMTYYAWKKYYKALYHDSIALDFFRKNNNKHFEAELNINLANVYHALKQNDKSFKYLEKAISIGKLINNSAILARANLSKATIFLSEKKYKKAEHIFNIIDLNTIFYKKLGDESKMQYLKTRFLLYQQKRDYSNAIKFQSLYLQKLNERYKAILSRAASLETLYQNQQKEKEIVDLKSKQAINDLELERYKQKQRLLLFALIGTIILFLIFTFYYRRNEKQKQLIESLQKNTYHSIKNNLGLISSIVDDIKMKISDKDVVQKLNNLNIRIDSINEIYKELYKNEVTDLIRIKYQVDKFIRIIRKVFSYKNNIQIFNEIDSKIKLKPDVSMLIILIIIEFITNSFKHAFEENQEGEIHIEMKYENDILVLSMKDNGKGFPKDFDINQIRTFGMDIMNLFTKKLKGNLSVVPYKGAYIRIEIPKINI